MPCIGNTEDVASSSRSKKRGAVHREVFGLVRQRVVDNVECLITLPMPNTGEKVALNVIISMYEERAELLSTETSALLKLLAAFPDNKDPEVALHTKSLLRGLCRCTHLVLHKAKVRREIIRMLQM